jgi:hypothetical protein
MCKVKWNYGIIKLQGTAILSMVVEYLSSLDYFGIIYKLETIVHTKLRVRSMVWIIVTSSRSA